VAVRRLRQQDTTCSSSSSSSCSITTSWSAALLEKNNCWIHLGDKQQNYSHTSGSS
jgi:hypothetical protein